MIGLFSFLRKAKTGRSMKRMLCVLVILFFFFSEDITAQLVLNEMMPFNVTTLSDQFNEYPDWVEVYNSGTGTESLGAYWLSDCCWY